MCGKTYRGMHGEMKSPGYPNGYRPNQRCEWEIIVPADVVEIHIIHLHLEVHDSCAYDSLKVCLQTSFFVLQQY